MAEEKQAGSDCLYVGRVETDGGRLNVRSAPGGEVIGSLERGTQASVLSDEGEWLEIEYAGGAGYVAKRYICFAQANAKARIVITDEEGNAFTPVGGFSLQVVFGEID